MRRPTWSGWISLRLPGGNALPFCSGWVMRPSVIFEANRETIRRVVQEHKATNPRVFGSVATGTDHEDSDLDLLVDALPGMSLFDQGGIIYDLEELLRIRVDVVTSGGIRQRYRDRIFAEALPV